MDCRHCRGSQAVSSHTPEEKKTLEMNFECLFRPEHAGLDIS
ncbi:hypothetical protein DSBG_1327 [Desulfosporosinus sp. BG]|nr:hypothetical protein DSBG_1327 [Desulfosporosinus sp. BG]